jgi:hypothetical protein
MCIGPVTFCELKALFFFLYFCRIRSVVADLITDYSTTMVSVPPKVYCLPECPLEAPVIPNRYEHLSDAGFR